MPAPGTAVVDAPPRAGSGTVDTTISSAPGAGTAGVFAYGFTGTFGSGTFGSGYFGGGTPILAVQPGTAQQDA